MFSIYGISGPVFQGTLENLSRLTPVVRRAPVIAARRVGDQIETGVAPTQTYAMSASGAGEEAVDAYQAMLPQNLERGPLYQSNQIMQTQVITVNADDDVARAWHVLIKNQIHQAPVLDAGSYLVGIVSDRNLLTALDVGEDQVHNALSKRVSDVMTTPVVAASPVTDIRHIAQVMLDHDVSGVPIVNDSGKLVGIISHSDILHAVVTNPPLSIWL